MKSVIFAAALLLGFCINTIGQSIPLKGGLLTKVQLPADLATCVKIGYIGKNQTESFILGKDCSGEVKIWRAAKNESFKVIVRESDLAPYKLLSWVKELGGGDFYLLPEIETRPDGLYFTLMSVQPEGFTFDTGSGGSYTIKGGQLKAYIKPGDAITYKDPSGLLRNVKVNFASLPFLKNGGGEYIFMKVSAVGNGATNMGIFLHQNDLWSMVLPFYVATTPGSPTAYGLGAPVSTYGILESLDKSLTFFQRWSEGGSSKFQLVNYNPITGNVAPKYEFGTSILGSNNYEASPRLNSETGQRFWRSTNGPFGDRTDWVTPAPNPDFTSWKWIVKAPGYYAMDLRGMSDNLGMYLLANSQSDTQGSTVGFWDGNSMKTLLSNGDAMPGGQKVTKLGNGFTNQNSLLPVSGCSALIGTYKTDDSLESLLRFEKPCLSEGAASGGQVVLFGKNLALTGTPTVLVDGIPVSGANVTAELVKFPSTGLAGGEHKVQVKLDGGLFSNEITISVPTTIPAPVITAVINGALQPNVQLAAGGLGSVFGTNLATITDDGTGKQTPLIKAFATPLPTKLGGTRVLVNGTPAPLTYAANFLNGTSQINFQMPNGVGPTAKIVVQRCKDINCEIVDANSAEFEVKVLKVSLAIFTYQDIPIVQIFNKNYQLVAESNPVEAGDVLIVWGTGCGPTDPLIPEGLSAKDITKATAASVVDVVESKLRYSLNGEPKSDNAIAIGAAASYEFAGLCQIAIQAPDISPDGEVYLKLKVGDVEVPDMKLPYTKKAVE